ncbi:hypothetical protein [Bacillus cereus]|uniref:hypothetical protein n=1 Tax=Bacillus cereus TaxID=1396 RepID=UPI00124F24FB|nr:hypothetical protein [Bacillus cereus]KAB2477776.1 hypothetical protein F8159_17565 [Bacillus cereus]
MTETTGILNGKYIDVNAVLAQKLLQQENAKKLLDTLGVAESDFTVKQGYAFDTKDQRTGKVLGVEVYEFLAPEKAQLHIKYLTNGEEGGYAFYADKVDNTIIETYEIHRGEVSKIGDRLLEGEFGVLFPTNLVDDKNFEILSSSVEVEEKGIEFCLAGYNHCGPGCGDGMSRGGTPRNRIDSCCRTHDRCWSNFGAWDPCCDKDLLRCVVQNQSVDPVAATAIHATFHYNSLKC